MKTTNNLSKKSKVKQSHVSSSKIGSGDYYGVGVRNAVGRVRNVFGYSSSGINTKTPPKKLG